jgi:hypothetical protein
MTPSGPTGATGATSMTGTWAGSASDSSSGSMGAGSLMGQAGMGTMTWPLTQSGSTVTGAMSFSGMQGRMPGSFSGTMSGEEMTFTMDMPNESMMSSGCSARATGTAHVDGTRMTLTGTYSGSNSCTGSFTNGQMAMTRR